MKNKLRLVVNWTVVILMPIWAMPFFVYWMITEMIECPDSEFRPVFKDGSEWWWE